MHFANRIKRVFLHGYELLKYNYHTYVYTFLKLKTIRRKTKIRFLFLLTELPTWKTEPLYLQMLDHPRFAPILGVTSSIESPGAEEKVVEYLVHKGYDYVIIDEKKTLVEQCKPDIIMYQKPYVEIRHSKHLMINNLKSLFVICEYGFHTTIGKWNMIQPVHRYGLHYYFENKSLGEQYRKLMPNKGRNIRITGTPFMDILSSLNKKIEDPWKDHTGKKRIIYAPHHTIGDQHFSGLAFSTFLENCDKFLELAEKYSEKACFAFKPHPRLYPNLVRLWGKKKTDTYYSRWESLKNGQLENGAYNGLFIHSDALIHDCGAFMVEYLYTHNPVMYLIGNNSDFSSFSEFTKEAFNVHYHGTTSDDIEQFIQNVINGNDEKKLLREDFYLHNLEIPNGKSACLNIIDTILNK